MLEFPQGNWLIGSKFNLYAGDLSLISLIGHKPDQIKNNWANHPLSCDSLTFSMTFLNLAISYPLDQAIWIILMSVFLLRSIYFETFQAFRWWSRVSEPSFPNPDMSYFLPLQFTSGLTQVVVFSYPFAWFILPLPWAFSACCHKSLICKDYPELSGRSLSFLVVILVFCFLTGSPWTSD